MAPAMTREQAVSVKIRNRTKIIVVLLLILPSALLQPQTNKSTQRTSDKTQLTFKLPVDVIPVAVTVTDHDGNVSMASDSEATIAITLPFQNAKQGKYKLSIEITDTASSQTAITQADLELVKN